MIFRISITLVFVASCFIVFYADAILIPYNGLIGSLARCVLDVIWQNSSEWLVVTATISYVIFMCFGAKNDGVSEPPLINPYLWLLACLILAAYNLLFTSLISIQTLTFFWCLFIGMAISLQIKADGEYGDSTIMSLAFVLLLIISLTISTFYQIPKWHLFKYRGVFRWSGPWDNPNLFGLLMGTGVVIAIGVLFFFMSNKLIRPVFKGLIICLFLILIMLMWRGLLYSLSRGAWVATGIGTFYLLAASDAKNSPETELLISSGAFSNHLRRIIRAHRKYMLMEVIMILCVGIIIYWNMQQTHWHPAKRAMSLTNWNDFSWRNRLLACEGALQIMAERPCLGVGWNQTELIYDNFYMPGKIFECAAITMNDYFILGTIFGLPALFCFGFYIYGSMGNTPPKKSQSPEAHRLSIACRAGVIVLLVGFWFDGGLFKLETASTFWILLELGNAETRQNV